MYIFSCDICFLVFYVFYFTLILMLQSVAHLNFILSCYTYILFCVSSHVFYSYFCRCFYCLIKVFINFIGAV